jgi:hypothetical protein
MFSVLSSSYAALKEKEQERRRKGRWAMADDEGDYDEEEEDEELQLSDGGQDMGCEEDEEVSDRGGL